MSRSFVFHNMMVDVTETLRDEFEVQQQGLPVALCSEVMAEYLAFFQSLDEATTATNHPLRKSIDT